MPPTTDTISRNEARRLALAAQGMASASRPQTTAGWQRIAGAIDTMNLLQIDSVNVVARSHYMPILARVGHYKPGTLDAPAFSMKKRQLFEYWAHEASLLPMKLHPLLRWRMARAANGEGIYKDLVAFSAERGDYLDLVRREIRARGPLRAKDLPEAAKSTKDWWSWSNAKTALEYLFWTGEVTAAERQNNFERHYDIPERVIPADILSLPTPSEADAIRQLLDLSGKALGIASETDLRDYFRLPLAQTRHALAELIEAGRLIPVKVEGWQHPGYLHTGAELPRRATGTALLSPFDPIVWNRDRAARIFRFNYKIEIYVPAAKRRYGYYVLPFLMNGHLAGRVCLKADRHNNTLLVNASHLEERRKPDETATLLAGSLRGLARWLALDDIKALDAGNLAGPLTSALREAGS